MTSSELIHYGVKGMHWGVRRNTPTNAGYTKNQQQTDRKNHGQGGVKRINRRLNKGQTLTKARKNEAKFRKRTRKAIVLGSASIRYREQVKAGAKIAGTLASLAAGIAVQHIAVKAETKRGQAAAANAMGLPRFVTDGPTFSKQNRKGVYDISSL